MTKEKATKTDQVEKESTNTEESLQPTMYDKLEEGSLLVFNVGDEKSPATDEDLLGLKEKLFDMFKDVKGIKILALPHNIKVDKFSVPQLRKIIDETVASTRSTENNPILDMEF